MILHFHLCTKISADKTHAICFAHPERTAVELQEMHGSGQAAPKRSEACMLRHYANGGWSSLGSDVDVCHRLQTLLIVCTRLNGPR